MEMNRLIIIIIFLFFGTAIYAQTTKVVSDLQLRNSIGLSYEVVDNFELSFKQELRLNHNASSYDKAFAELGASYKLNKYLKVGGNYRFYKNQQWDGDYENQQRWALKVNAKYKIERFKFKYRIQFQNKDEDFWANDSENYNVYNLKNRFSVAYNIPKIKLEPEISAELFRRYYNETAEFSKMRFGASLLYPIKKWLDADVGYYLERELNTTQPASINIVKVGLNFNF